MYHIILLVLCLSLSSGSSVCADCSRKRYLIPYVDAKNEARVCDECHILLSAGLGTMYDVNMSRFSSAPEVLILILEHTYSFCYRILTAHCMYVCYVGLGSNSRICRPPLPGAQHVFGGLTPLSQTGSCLFVKLERVTLTS